MFTYSGGGVPLYRTDILRARHGFSTRRGGVSTLEHTASLNLGFNRGDSDETVYENLRRFVGALACQNDGGCTSDNAENPPYVKMSQVHCTDVIYVNGENCGEKFTCDGLVTDVPGICLIARSADCVPVLLEYRENGVPSVIGAIHAGWRGTVANIMASAVAAMVRTGAKPSGIYAAIGPCIHVCHFEIGAEVANEFSAAGLDGCVHESGRDDGKFYADLVRANTENLICAGVMTGHIDALDKCTVCNDGEFYSHRATGGKRGTLGAGIIL